ncbi:MAG: Nitrogen regulatory protein P-II [Turneriella sp.]|nr:Nitrogen regulatory protein P-II [Turneriella sp.]
MKLIIALIQPHRLEAVKRELNKREIFRLTVTEAMGYGRQKGQLQYFRGQEMESELINKIELQIGVNDAFVEPTIDAIMAGARSDSTGQIGDGKIFVLPLDEVVRISDGTRGGEAI